MSRILSDRMTVEIEGDFVVFLIGMRFNKLWKVWKWWPVVMAMPRMLRELANQPDLGLLHSQTYMSFRNLMVVQYWRSFEQLHEYSTGKSFAHLPAWKAFNNSIGVSGDVGIWHETYLVSDGQYEAVYGNMPECGLGLAGKLIPAAGQAGSAKGRLRKTDGNDQPVQMIVAEEVREEQTQ